MCPFNAKFARELKEPAYAPRPAIAGKDARQLARDLLAMTQEEFSRAFSKSPMKRAKLRGLRRNAAVVLGNVGSAEDVVFLARMRDEELDEMVREHIGWAHDRIAGRIAESGPER